MLMDADANKIRKNQTFLKKVVISKKTRKEKERKWMLIFTKNIRFEHFWTMAVSEAGQREGPPPLLGWKDMNVEVVM